MEPARSIFISYRRDDSAGFAGRLADALEASLGEGSVFRDVDDISPGEDFVAAIEQALASSAALLVVIGRRWLTATDAAGRRRLDQPQDFVRLEIQLALQRGMRVIPVLVDRATMPSEDQLPGEIAALARRQAVELDDSRWNADIERLLRSLGVAATPKRKPLQLHGVWLEDDQLRWVFTPADVGYRVETFRSDGGGIWARGTAHLSPAGVEVRLDLVYSDAYRYSVQLQPNDDGTVLTGTSNELVTNTSRPIELRRDTHPE
jgi:hypothetical protein